MKFLKFDGAGNDFVAIDNRDGQLGLSQAEVERICHRRFGVGADGLLMLNATSDEYDFEMVYYNSDGRVGTMCGNGGRCIAVFAMLLGMGKRLSFVANDGLHHAEIEQWDAQRGRGIVRLSMRSIEKGDMRRILNGWYINTGSPHYVQHVYGLDGLNVEQEGRALRQREDLFPGGANIDFVEWNGDGLLSVRTYERGVEAETWACGTGVTACAIVEGTHQIITRGGEFEVEYKEDEAAYTDVWLRGPVAFNFSGEWPWNAER